MAIEWATIGQPRFDRIIEALVHRLYDATATVTPVNGRGGDTGIDIEVRQGSRLRIYQLKYYCDGFPANSRGRRPSIKKSFERAMEHSPYEWVLVVPCTLGTGERKFVKNLAGDRDVRIKVMDRAELDDRLAVHSDIEASFTRDRLYELAKTYNRERDLLMGGPADLSARVRALGGVVDDVDTDWTLDFARQGDTVIHTLRARHPRAHEVSPITIRLKSRPEALDPDLSAALERAVGFGTAEELVLPPEAVERLSIEGPEWISQEFSNVGVMWRREPHDLPVGTEAEVAFLTDTEAVSASYVGTLTDIGQGPAGRSITLDVDGVSLQLLMPHTPNAEARMGCSLTVAGQDTSTALRAIGLHKRLLGGGVFRISVAEYVVCSGVLPKGHAPARLQQVDQVRELVTDLEHVQRHCERFFPVPAEISARERVLLRLARRLVDGQCVVNPFARTLRLALNGTGADNLRRLLGGGLMHANRPECPITIAGHTLDLGPTRIFHPHVTIDDADQALAVINTGDFAGLRLTLRPVEDQHYRLILTDALQASPLNQPVQPVPFALDGYREPA